MKFAILLPFLVLAETRTLRHRHEGCKDVSCSKLDPSLELEKSSRVERSESRYLQEGTWEEITYDDFESGFAGSNFAAGGSDASIVNQNAHQGQASLRIRDNSGVASSAYYKMDQDVMGYSDLRVKFWFFPLSMENGEEFLLEYSSNGGSDWDTVKTYQRGRDFNNGNFYEDTVVLSDSELSEAAYELSTQARIRFRCDASSNNDNIYIDDVSFQGFVTAGPNTPAPTPSPTFMPSSEPSLEPSDTPSNAPSPTPLSCPEEHCGSLPVTTMDPTQCDSTGIQSVQLEVFTNNGVDLIELLGPSNPADAAAVVISVPHGGSLTPDFIADRTTSHPDCPSSGCVTIKDSNTLEIAEIIIDKFIQNYCKVPYVVMNKLHRRKLDANREISEAAQGDPIAEDAWLAFHNFIQTAQNHVIGKMGTVTNTVGVEGARGLLFDLHGYAGFEWNVADGGYFIHWGYRFGSSSLDPDQYCPLDNRSPSDTSTVGTLTHARFLSGQSYECLVRGPGSLGTRVSALPNMGLCGAGLPSYEYPSPSALQADPSYCEDPPCGYWSGGYDTEVHEHLDWDNLSGIKFNAVQAELPRCIRFNSAAREQFADSVSIALCSFLRDVFPGEIFEAETC